MLLQARIESARKVGVIQSPTFAYDSFRFNFLPLIYSSVFLLPLSAFLFFFFSPIVFFFFVYTIYRYVSIFPIFFFIFLLLFIFIFFFHLPPFLYFYVLCSWMKKERDTRHSLHVTLLILARLGIKHLSHNILKVSKETSFLTLTIKLTFMLQVSMLIISYKCTNNYFLDALNVLLSHMYYL